ncbi:hypothetical protein [Microbacterium sp.]|uniref:hypothetical protein n=1 Tax=Microbacterium sp. TaxID=51671 RepID=UPI002811D651|nr:hypothetical protein [Microbacterium sp.]
MTITSGGQIAVDSGAVRDIGRRLRDVGARLADACDLMRRAGHALSQAPHVEQSVGITGITASAGRLSDLAPVVDQIAQGCEVMADTFELVELRAQQEAVSVADPAAAEALQARIDVLVQSDPEIENRVKWLAADGEKQRYAGTGDQPLDLFGPLVTGLTTATLSLAVPPGLGMLAGALAGGFLGPRPAEKILRTGIDAANQLGRGALPPGTRLTGAPPPVEVRLVATGATAAPTSLKQSMERIPYGRAGQVVVEKYTMNDGTKRFVAYLDGTRAVMPGTDDPWDMSSNWDMYMNRETAASQQAALVALEQAGARPGDHVDFVGYSQGATIASFAAMDSPYTVSTVITAGNPVDPWLTEEQTHVRLEHDADFVANLAGDPSPGGSGSAESFTATRDVDKLLFWDEHDFGQYTETAGLVDTSGDPRVAALRDGFYAELGEAVSVERMEFEAKRP